MTGALAAAAAAGCGTSPPVGVASGGGGAPGTTTTATSTTPPWAVLLGEMNAGATAIAADAQGNVVVGGSLGLMSSLGCGDVVGTGDGSGFIAKLSSSGACVWARGSGDGALTEASTSTPQSVAIDASGNVFATGSFSGPIDLGGGPLVIAGTAVFVVKLDPDGNHLWSEGFGATGDAAVGTSIAVDTAGHVAVTGYFTGAVDFGGGPLLAENCTAAFVAQLDAGDGHHGWSHSYSGNCPKTAPPDPANTQGSGIAVDGAGNVLVTGSFDQTLSFGSAATLTSAGQDDVFVVKLDPGGAHLWSARFGDSDEQVGTALAIDAAGNVDLTGYFTGSIDFGGGALTGDNLSPNNDGGSVYLASLDPQGHALSSKSFGVNNRSVSNGVAIDGAGDVILGGSFRGTMDFASGPLQSLGQPSPGDAFVARLDASGNGKWGAQFGDASGAMVTGVAADAAGDIFVTGAFVGTIDFGSGPLTAIPGYWQPFVAKVHVP